MRVANNNLVEYASEKLKDDEDFILKLIKNNGYVLRYCLDKYKDNKKMLRSRLKMMASIYNLLLIILKMILEVVREAVQNDSRAFKYEGRKIKYKFSIIEVVLKS